MAEDYYSILGVAQEATPQDIKKAFRQIARECHPDVAGEDPAAAVRFKSAKKAYETLIDPVTRSRYDRRGQRRARGSGSFFDAFYSRSGEAAPQNRKKNPGFSGGDPEDRPRRRKADPGNDLDLDDLFKDFADFGFGGSGGRAKRTTGTSPGNPTHDGQAPRPQPGADVQIVLDVPAEVARNGGTVTAVYYRMQRSDSWRPGATDAGVVRIQDIADIRIIPGTRDGEVLRERGLGDAGPYGGPYGDLLSRVRVQGTATAGAPPPSSETPPPSESRRGRSAAPAEEARLDISVVEALLGGRIELTTPQGRVRVTIPPGTSSGTRLRLKGRGSTGPDGEAVDLYVSVRIVTPKALDAESRRLIERFAELNPGTPRD